MTDVQIKSLLKAIGISSGIILIVLIVGATFVFYKNYLETKKLKLQIAFLQKTLSTPNTVAQANPMEGSYRGITELKK